MDHSAAGRHERSLRPGGVSVRSLVALLSILAVFGGATSAQAMVDHVILGVGYGDDDYLVYRVGVRNDLGRSFFLSNVGYLTGHVEAALLHWRSDREALYGGVVAPAASYYFGSESWTIRPFVRGGVGATYLSDTQMRGRYLSTRFQFEDRIGIGFEWERLRAQLSFAHYSNGSIRLPNDGMEELILTVGWSLQ